LHENERKLRDLFDTIDRGEFDRFREFFAEDVFYERPAYPPLTGVEDLIRFYRDERIIASGQHMPEHVVANEACGAAWGRYQGVTRTGEPIDVIWADVYSFDDRGLIKSRRGYFFQKAGKRL